jgi:hypothetical protein
VAAGDAVPPVAVIVIRAWTEAEGADQFRARLTFSPDVTTNVSTTRRYSASPDEVAKLAAAWLHEFAAGLSADSD